MNYIGLPPPSLLRRRWLLQISSSSAWSSQHLDLNTVVSRLVFVSLPLSSNHIRPTDVFVTIDSRIFLSCDLIALVVQAAGGAIASTAKTHEGSANGGKIMLGGIVFQLGKRS
jgi:hypothetical protein